ncbi:pilus assembly FimT family protein [Cupriavidus cauae]|uniref:pilus assembly FimT family protein n=1 Tax=Cupriavidus cauae TaxID=2608999 RepID=UPI001CC1E829|nr:pilus assembly protein [Cupriavidus cauae]
MAGGLLSVRGGERGRHPARSAGATLIEWLAAMAITATLAAAGYPSYRDALERQQVRLAADLLAASIETAREFALARRSTVLLAPQPGFSDFSRGWHIVAREARVADGATGATGATGAIGATRASGASEATRTSQAPDAPVLSSVGLAAACLRVALRATDGGRALRLAPVGYSRSERGGFYAATFTLRCGHAQRQVRLGALGRLRICTPGHDADCDSRIDSEP